MMSKLISQCVCFGSPFLALKHEFFSPKDLKRWLAEDKESEKTWNINHLVAYKALSCYQDPKDQYCEDGKHLLIHNPFLGCLYVRMGGDMELPSEKDGSVPLFIELVEEISNYNITTNQKLELFCIIGARLLSRDMINDKIQLLLQSRQFKKTPELNDKTMTPFILRADWIDKIVQTPLLPIHLLERWLQLERDAPDYWKLVQPLYRPILEEMWNGHRFKSITRECLSGLDRLMPGIIDRKMLDLSDFQFTLSLLPLQEKAYILGLPIHLQDFKPKDVQSTLEHFLKTPLEDYLSTIAEYNRSMNKYHPPTFPWLSACDLILGNDTDLTFVNAIHDYSPFDIYYYVCEGHLFRFVRFEFDNILETGKNPWTNKPLPKWVLSEIRGRVEAAAEWGFSESLPLLEIYEKIQAGEYFQPLPKPKSRDEEEEEPETEINEILSLLGSAILMQRFGGEIASIINTDDFDMRIDPISLPYPPRRMTLSELEDDTSGMEEVD